ncbi:MAG: PKD domain-containing protein, partial [Chitinophagaceae bacterium]|nr:PKD domain-containing protein [Chitinophagaceae bacterium]
MTLSETTINQGTFPKGRSYFLQWLITAAFLFFSSVIFAQAPVANFTATTTSGCSPLNVQFTDQSSNNPIFWNWDLGNGQLSTAQNPVTQYSAPGTYTVTLVVRNAAGINSITRTDYIVVNPSPSANLSANIRTACVPATIQFTDITIPNAGTITDWLWDFGDGTTSTLQNPQKNYIQPGFYTISLRVTSSTGCVGAIAIGNYIRIVSGVTAEFSSTPAATCRPPYIVNFSDLTSGPGNITYSWDFGNSTTSTLQNPVATYAAPGTYTVSLTASSEFGCSNTITRDIIINSTATTISSPDTVCLNTVVNFQNGSAPLPVSSVWDFGNAIQSDKLSDSTSYSAPGTYQVRLINTYTECVDSAFKNIVVRPRPTVDFTAANTIACQAPFSVAFQDLSPNSA